MRVSVHLAPCLVAGALLAGCGGGGSSSTTVSSAASVPASAAPSVTATKPSVAPPSPPSHPATPHRAAHLSAAARGFLVKGADNSIPEYGKEAGASERESVRAALSTFLQARAKGEWSRACAGLAHPVRKQLERLFQSPKAKAGSSAANCGRALAAFSGRSAAARADPLTAGVAVVRVKGTFAFALFHGPHAGKYLITMINEGGTWKANEVAPQPYPLGSPATP